LTVCFAWTGLLFLVFFPVPAALGKFFASLLDDARPLAVMGLLRGAEPMPEW